MNLQNTAREVLRKSRIALLAVLVHHDVNYTIDLDGGDTPPFDW